MATKYLPAIIKPTNIVRVDLKIQNRPFIKKCSLPLPTSPLKIGCFIKKIPLVHAHTCSSDQFTMNPLIEDIFICLLHLPTLQIYIVTPAKFNQTLHRPTTICKSGNPFEAPLFIYKEKSAADFFSGTPKMNRGT